MVGVPVIINHKDLNKDNADDERIGVVNSVWYDEKDGWYWCDGIIWDETAQNLITDKKWSVSCSYDVKTANDEGGSENNIKYDVEFLDGVFTHLALVDNPRYERANIILNSKTEFVKDNKMEIENENNEKGKWVTIKGTHVFIPDGKTIDEVVEEKFGDKANKQSDSKKEKKENKTTTKDDELVNITEDYYNRISEDELKKEFKDIQKEFAKWKDKKNFPEYKDYKNKLLKIKDIYEKRFGKQSDSKDQNKADNSKEQDMALIEELKKLITKVENDKEGEQDMTVENEKVDKRKLIDEVGGILKGKVDDEIIRTIIGKLEKVAYEKSEADTADNEKEEDAKNCKKVKNEDEKDEKEVKEVKEEVKEDVENKCKNSVDNSKTDYFAKLNEIYNSASSQMEPKTDYVSRADREQAAIDYFAR